MRSVIYYPSLDGLQPISYYLHPGLWMIGTKEITDDRAVNNLSLIEWILRHLMFNGLKDFVFLGKKQIEQLSAQKKLYEYDFGINVELKGSDELRTIELINTLDDEDTLFYFGTVLSNTDIDQFIRYHESHDRVCTLLISQGIQYRVGLAKVNKDNVITSFLEKPYDKTMSSFTGIFILRKGWKHHLQDFLLNSSLAKGKEFGTSLIEEFIRFLIEEREVKVHIKKGIKNADSWWINLSELETWVKLNPDIIIDKMDFLTG